MSFRVPSYWCAGVWGQALAQLGRNPVIVWSGRLGDKGDFLPVVAVKKERKAGAAGARRRPERDGEGFIGGFGGSLAPLSNFGGAGGANCRRVVFIHARKATVHTRVRGRDEPNPRLSRGAQASSAPPPPPPPPSSHRGHFARVDSNAARTGCGTHTMDHYPL